MVLFETNWKRNISTKASKKAPYSIPIRTILVQKRCSWVPSFEVINQIIKMSVLIFIVSIHENIFLIQIKISWLTKLVAEFKKKTVHMGIKRRKSLYDFNKCFCGTTENSFKGCECFISHSFQDFNRKPWKEVYQSL